MKTKTHFAFRVDIWDDTGDSIKVHDHQGRLQHSDNVEFDVRGAKWNCAPRWVIREIPFTFRKRF